VAPTWWYGDAPGWDRNQGSEWEAHATSTWQSEHLPDGSASIDIQEEKEKEVLPEESIPEDHVGLSIEEDEDVNQSEESSSSGSPEYLQARSYIRMYISCTSLKNVHEIYLKTAFDVHWYIHLTYNEKNQNVQYDLHCY